MPPLSVTPVYAAAFAVMLVVLAFRVVRLRFALRVSLDDGGHDVLARAIRTHGNFVEYVPLTLILMAVAEVNGMPAWGLHVLGGTMVAGRLLHAHGLIAGVLKTRQAGMVLTVAVLLAGAALAIGSVLA